MVSILSQLLTDIKIVPVLTIDTVEDALQVCQALSAGGINAVEITLRTHAALDAIKEVKNTMQGFHVAAGTIKTPADIEILASIGIAFGVSPGLTPILSQCAFQNDFAFLPGVATPSELMFGLETGRDCFKLFPAEAVGGIPLLKSLGSPFAEAKFCPTGGISTGNYLDYLSLPNVLAVGGSWMVAPALIKEKQWGKITDLSRAAIQGISAD